MTVDFRIDYFRITVHLPLDECIKLYDECFSFALGKLVDLEHGAKGFKGVMGSLQGFQLKHSPGGDREEYCTFEFPGQACGSVAPEQFKDFYILLRLRSYKINVTRLDLAFDNVPFTPFEFYQAILDDVNLPAGSEPIVRSLTQRQSVKWISSPLQKLEDGSGVSQDTCYFGKRSSQRFLRVYNQRGPTRLELEVKAERASGIADKLFPAPIDDWPRISIAHLLDFIDIDRPWWQEFINNEDRAYMKLHYAKDLVLEDKIQWLLIQVSPTYAAVSKLTDGDIMFKMDVEGRRRMGKRYGPLLTAHGSIKS